MEIKHNLRIRKSLNEVYKAVTSSEGLEGWWVVDADIDDDEIVIGFGDYGNMKIKVIKSIKNWEIVWKCLDTEWKGSTIRFNLENENGSTYLKFSHTGLELDEENLNNINYNWGRYLFSLKIFTERGEGFPIGY